MSNSAGGPTNPFDSAGGNPYDNPYVLPPRATGPTYSAVRTSGMAIASMVLGIVSVPLLCACGLSAITSIVGVVLGHVARAGIRKSAGSVSGGGMAIAGLVLGYLCLALSVANLINFYFQLTKTLEATPARNPRSAAMSAAEREIGTLSDGHAHGNTPRARELAQEFNTAMEAFDQENFTQVDSKLKLSVQHYDTYCELHDGQCLLLTHVPDYRRFEDDAKEHLADGAWRIAQAVTAGDLSAGDSLGVGMKGVLLYGAVMTGTVAEAGADSAPDEKDADEGRLRAFFGEPERPFTVPIRQPNRDDSASPAGVEPETTDGEFLWDAETDEQSDYLFDDGQRDDEDSADE